MSHSASATRPLSGLKREVVLHYAEASHQQLIILVLSSSSFTQYFRSFTESVAVYEGGNSHSRTLSQSQDTAATVIFAYGSMYKFL
jgi:hypothetical protein